jgi:hypothetical protein
VDAARHLRRRTARRVDANNALPSTWDPGITIGVSRGGSNVPVLSCAAAVLATYGLG